MNVDFNSWSDEELIAEAERIGIAGFTTMSREELIEALEEVLDGTPDE